MSDAMKVLESIEARLKAQADTVDRYFARGSEEDLWSDADSAHLDALVQNAPADLALLARIVRSVAEVSCERLGPNNEPMCEKPWALPSIACWPCRVRRELSEVAR